MKNNVEFVDKQLKAELLLHYSERNPNMFYQMDAFITGPNKHDIECSYGNTFELMHGADVRLLIGAETKHEDAVRALQLLLERLIENGDCKRCGGRNGFHHSCCADENLSDEQVQAVVAFDTQQKERGKELPF